MKDIPQDRPLSNAELELVRWMLQHGSSEALQFLPQLSNARVISRCRCGCASVDFAISGQHAPPSAKMKVLADFAYGDQDNLCGAFVFARANFLAGLEVYALAGDTPLVLPSPNELRPFDQTT